MDNTVQIAVVMDPIATIKPAGDSTLAVLLQAQAIGCQLHYAEPRDLWLRDGEAFGRLTPLRVMDDQESWFDLGDSTVRPLGDIDAILMRKDPPFDMEYIYTTYILERAELRGSVVVNRPQSLRDANEKVVISWFSQCAPPMLVSSSLTDLRAFVDEHERTVIKPLDRMAGRSIFSTGSADPNRNVILETLTDYGSRFVMAQKYIPEATVGDKRILLIDGDPISDALLRIPPADDFRGNLSSGATAKAVPLTDRDRWICEQIGPRLSATGLLFVGIDIIGDFLTEVNVTSPTGIRELDRLCDRNIGRSVIEAILHRVANPP